MFPESCREFGPKCPHCGRRNMERMGERLYRCQNSGETFQLRVTAQGITMEALIEHADRT